MYQKGKLNLEEQQRAMLHDVTLPKLVPTGVLCGRHPSAKDA